LWDIAVQCLNRLGLRRAAPLPNEDCRLHRPSSIDAISRTATGVAAAVLLSFGLAGCGSISERTAAAAFTSPGKFDVYTCQDIETSAATLKKRQLELEQLMARASKGSGGEFVNIIAYRGEYAQGRGELVEMNKALADKQCATESKFSSGRAVF
jgi:hypothetical protein